MATHDVTRHLFQPRKHYASVRMQQRRTITDADYDEGEQIREETARRTRVDLIGESGSPDFGHRVAPGSLVTLADGTIDFELSAGTLYVGGNRLERFEHERFRFQGDWLQQCPADRPTAPDATRQDVVFVLAWQAVVTPTEDSELYEASLGPHVDTSVRVRQFARVMVQQDVTGEDCDQAWTNASAAFLEELCPGAKLAPDGEVISQIRLVVTFSAPTPTEDPCAPCVNKVAGGYLAAENQAIRVMIVGDGTQYTWGVDNASQLHRVRISEGKIVTLVDPPTREVLHPLRGQTVEILPWGAVLDNGEKAAEPVGFFTRVARSFDARDDKLELETAPPGTFVESWPGHPREDELHGADGPYHFMRVWRRGTDRMSAPVRMIPGPGKPEALGNTGLEVHFSAFRGCPGDYWVIAARRDQPSRLVPWDLQGLPPASPHGPRRFLAPLARIQWNVDGGSSTFEVIDCRPRFLALARLPECSTFTVGAGAGRCSGHFETIQAAIDALPSTGGTIHVLPGTYAEHVRIDGRVDVRIRGCGSRTRIVNPLGAKTIASRQDPPLVLIGNSQRITLDELTVTADGIAGVRVVHDRERNGGPPREIDLRELTVTTREASLVATNEVSQARSTIELLDAHDVRIEGCELRMEAPLSVFPALFLLGQRVSLARCRVTTTGAAAGAQPWGGVQIPGGAVDVTVEDCDITGGLGHGITLGSIDYAPPDATGRPVLAQGTTVPVGDAAIGLDEGAGVVSLFAQARQAGNVLLLPIPGPLVRRVRIVRNRIHGALTSGIAAAAFLSVVYENPPQPSAIMLADVTIENNEISGNALVPPRVGNQSLPARIPGAGGISLPAVAGLRVVGNRIVDNGASFVDPVVGLYVLEGGAIEVSGNTIAQNGRRLRDVGGVRRGRRGGVVVMRAVVHEGDFSSGGPSLAELLPPVPRSALVVRANSIAQPEGKALYVPDLRGDALVEGNVMSSQGDTMPFVESLDEVELRVRIFRNGGQECDSRTRRGVGTVVYLRNNVRSIDAFVTSAQGRLGSRIGFNANQVILDWADASTPGPQLCSVLIDSLFDEANDEDDDAGAGDVSVVGNQFQAIMVQSDDPKLVADPARNVLLAQVIVLGRSVRLVSNRISEGRTDALISAFVWGSGFLPWASLNIATHCIVGAPTRDSAPVVRDNAILDSSDRECAFSVDKTGTRRWFLHQSDCPPPE